MSIVSITWARNEEDILESFLRYHCALLDHMHIILHRCEDGSEAIVQCLQEEGLPISVSRSSVLHHDQSDALTSLMQNLARTESPDWILPLDADEFLHTIHPLASILEAADSEIVHLLPWKTYVPLATDLPHPDVRMKVTHRRAEEVQQFYKVLIPKALAARSILPLGSHTLEKKDGEGEWTTHVHPSLWLAHVPVRTETQLRQKIVNSWDSFCLNKDRVAGQNFQWEHLYERCKDARPMDAQELTTIALAYAVADETLTPVIHDPMAIFKNDASFLMHTKKSSAVRCAFIVVWLGPFPIWFNFFLESCKHNEALFDWLIFTDQPSPDGPHNVFFHPIDLESINDRIRTRLGYTISVPIPYKLCDWKIFYGLLFADYVEPYTYWGHCDIDVIWGDLQLFLGVNIQQGYDIVTADATRTSGFCTLYKNEPRINHLCMEIPNVTFYMQKKDYAYVDEWHLPKLLALRPDISVSYALRYLEDPDNRLITWENGHLFANNEERALLHMHMWWRTRKNMTVETQEAHMHARWIINQQGFFLGEHYQPPLIHNNNDDSKGILIIVGQQEGEGAVALISSIRKWNDIPILVVNHGMDPISAASIKQFSNVLCMSIAQYGEGLLLPSLIAQSPFTYTLYIAPHCIVLQPLDEAFVIMREHMLINIHHGAFIDSRICKAMCQSYSPSIKPPYDAMFHLSADVIGFKHDRDVGILQYWNAVLSTISTAAFAVENSLLQTIQTTEVTWVVSASHVWNAAPLPTSSLTNRFTENIRRGDRIVNLTHPTVPPILLEQTSTLSPLRHMISLMKRFIRGNTL